MNEMRPRTKMSKEKLDFDRDIENLVHFLTTSVATAQEHSPPASIQCDETQNLDVANVDRTYSVPERRHGVPSDSCEQRSQREIHIGLVDNFQIRDCVHTPDQVLHHDAVEFQKHIEVDEGLCIHKEKSKTACNDLNVNPHEIYTKYSAKIGQTTASLSTSEVMHSLNGVANSSDKVHAPAESSANTVQQATDISNKQLICHTSTSRMALQSALAALKTSLLASVEDPTAAQRKADTTGMSDEASSKDTYLYRPALARSQYPTQVDTMSFVLARDACYILKIPEGYSVQDISKMCEDLPNTRTKLARLRTYTVQARKAVIRFIEAVSDTPASEHISPDYLPLLCMIVTSHFLVGVSEFGLHVLPLHYVHDAVMDLDALLEHFMRGRAVSLRVVKRLLIAGLSQSSVSVLASTCRRLGMTLALESSSSTAVGPSLPLPDTPQLSDIWLPVPHNYKMDQELEVALVHDANVMSSYTSRPQADVTCQRLHWVRRYVVHILARNRAAAWYGRSACKPGPGRSRVTIHIHGAEQHPASSHLWNGLLHRLNDCVENKPVVQCKKSDCVARDKITGEELSVTVRVIWMVGDGTAAHKDAELSWHSVEILLQQYGLPLPEGCKDGATTVRDMAGFGGEFRLWRRNRLLTKDILFTTDLLHRWPRVRRPYAMHKSYSGPTVAPQELVSVCLLPIISAKFEPHCIQLPQPVPHLTWLQHPWKPLSMDCPHLNTIHEMILSDPLLLFHLREHLHSPWDVTGTLFRKAVITVTKISATDDLPGYWEVLQQRPLTAEADSQHDGAPWRWSYMPTTLLESDHLQPLPQDCQSWKEMVLIYTCSSCSTMFQSWKEFSQHAKTHGEVADLKATVSFTRARECVREATTDLELAFACIECGKAFGSSVDIRLHEVLHHNKSLYQEDIQVTK